MALNGKTQSGSRGLSTSCQSMPHEMIPAPMVDIGMSGAVMEVCRFIGICSEVPDSIAHAAPHCKPGREA